MLILTANKKLRSAVLYKELLLCWYHCKYLSSTARHLFDEIPERNELQPFDLFAESYNSTGFAKKAQEEKSEFSPSRHGIAHKTLVRFGLGTKPAKFVLCNALNSCAKKRNLQLGLQIHAQIIQICYDENLFINSALVDMYAKCGSLVDAKRVFDGMKCHDQVSWTSIITGFSQNGYGREAISLFKEMLGTTIQPNCFTYVSVISGCRELESSYVCGTLLHAHVIQLGHESNSFVVSALIDWYSKCGRIDQAVLLFEATRVRDSILLNSMISGYSRNLYGEEALKLFMEMRNDNLSPTEHTLTSILDACGSLTVLQQGRQVHALIIKVGSDRNVFVVSSLIDAYSKCGNIDEARRVFDQTAEKNSILWTSMITGYAQSGRGLDGLQLFELLMNKEEFVPDHICFTAVLTACNHAGFLDKGIEYFNKMRMDYSLIPELDQYACLVDLYARNGNLRKAKEVMDQMPFKPNSVMWSSFLSSCKVHSELELGREAAYKLFELEPRSVVPYLTLANLYAGAGLWSEVDEMRRLMNLKGLRKSAGWSWIEIETKVHVFSVGDLSHPHTREIYVELDNLNMEMKEVGYVPKQVSEVEIVSNGQLQ